jgi:hypothetical protein
MPPPPNSPRPLTQVAFPSTFPRPWALLLPSSIHGGGWGERKYGRTILVPAPPCPSWGALTNGRGERGRRKGLKRSSLHGPSPDTSSPSTSFNPTPFAGGRGQCLGGEAIPAVLSKKGVTEDAGCVDLRRPGRNFPWIKLELQQGDLPFLSHSSPPSSPLTTFLAESVVQDPDLPDSTPKVYRPFAGRKALATQHQAPLILPQRH